MATRLLKKVTPTHFGHAVKALGLPERIVEKDEQGRLILLIKEAHVPIVGDDGEVITDGLTLRKHYEAKGFVLVPDGESKALAREAFLAKISK
jgi:hypothetical protein